jgi:hypothetical protein
LNYWQYDTPHFYDIFKNSQPIRYNDLFPAIRVGRVLNMIESQFGINFNTLFEVDDKFENAYLWLKNAELFNPLYTGSSFISSAVSYYLGRSISTFNVATNTLTYVNPNPSAGFGQMLCTAYFTARTPNATIGKKYWFEILLNGKRVTLTEGIVQNNTSYGLIYASALPNFNLFNVNSDSIPQGNYTYKFSCEESVALTNVSFNYSSASGSFGSYTVYEDTNVTIPNYTYTGNLLLSSLMPEIKIEDFFSGILKMFNLTCFTQDGINYTIEPLDDYYNAGSDVDLTKYVIQDKKNLNRVKSYKKINFDYEKSESITNVSFNSNAGIEYGSLSYSTGNDGEEYSIKLPFENLGFQNLTGLLQVGYALKTDLKPYIPKPVILYAYKQSGTTTVPKFHFSTNPTGNGAEYTEYHAFGQETLVSGQTYSLNFNEQQSTLTNEVVFNGLYQMYYSNYFANIFNFKARLIKISTILPTSILTTLKLNDSIIIRDTKYIINTMTTDITTGEVQFELLTDQRQ